MDTHNVLSVHLPQGFLLLLWTGHVTPNITSSVVQMRKSNFWDILLCRPDWKSTFLECQNVSRGFSLQYLGFMLVNDGRAGVHTQRQWWSCCRRSNRPRINGGDLSSQSHSEKQRKGTFNSTAQLSLLLESLIDRWRSVIKRVSAFSSFVHKNSKIDT